MTNLDKIISPKDYKVFAGPDWPSYQEILSGAVVGNAAIQQEVADFVSMMTQTYQETILNGVVLAEQNQQRQGQVFFNKQLQGSKNCGAPWDTMSINKNGDIFICSCSSWLPKPVGNLLQTQSVFDALNSDTAQKIRQEIQAGRYFYCNNQICSFFKNVDPATYQTVAVDTEPLPFTANNQQLLISQIPRNLIFEFDYTCNFQCPSCRTELINHNKHHVIRPINNNIVEHIKQQIIDQIQEQPVEIRWCGGEPFISEVYLELLEYILQSNKPNIQHIIQTNGSYLQKKSDLIEKLLPTLVELRVSFDAATAETYSKTRVNGQWDTLLANVRWARKTIDIAQTNTTLSADFVVQADNYQEIPKFIELCNSMGIDQINFQNMWNWGTWPEHTFQSKNVNHTEHPGHAELVRICKQANISLGFQS
jgi:sulfatase maturation enzyme AslB (radical SAM superfamily)